MIKWLKTEKTHTRGRLILSILCEVLGGALIGSAITDIIYQSKKGDKNDVK